MEFLNHQDQDSHNNQLKRKRITSPLQDSAASLSAHPSNNHLQHHHQPQHKPASPAPSNQHLTINYLARLRSEDLPLVSNDDNLQTILRLVGDYHGVLDRHESLACNLGARSLGPILIKRFERLFDAPPKILANHGKDAAHVTWLDVAEFARSKPDQFTIDQDHSGQQVRQFWTKQCHVQINDEDYMLLSSGIPQKMIPPQPIVEDEEKELGTLEILEKNLNGIISLADQVAAKGRQLNHRIRSRKQAILDRRASDAEISYTTSHQSNGSSLNAFSNANPPVTGSPIGFVAVNSRQHTDAHAELSRNGASSATHNELLSKFFTTSDKTTRPIAPSPAPAAADDSRAGARIPANMPSRQSLAANFAAMHSQHNSSSHIDFPLTDSFAPNQAAAQAAALSALGIPSSLGSFPPGGSSGPQHTQPSTPSAGAAPHFPTSQQSANPTPAKDEGPYKALMVQRMEQLKKGDRIYPPCDRCRRLHMDCTKNLTACAGCTKKHAKCSWRDVQEGEIASSAPAVNGDGPAAGGYMAAPSVPSLERNNSGSRDHSNGNGNGLHERSHPYYNPGTPATNGANGRNDFKPRPISSRSSSGNGFMPSLLNPEEPTQSSTSAPHDTHDVHSPLDPVAAASLAAAAHAASVTHSMTNGDRDRNGDVAMSGYERNGYKQESYENGNSIDRRDRHDSRDKITGTSGTGS